MVADWQDEYRVRMANKAVLIIVDDVWSKTDIEPLLAESPRSRFLFATRDASKRFVGTHEHRADLLDMGAIWGHRRTPPTRARNYPFTICSPAHPG